MNNLLFWRATGKSAANFVMTTTATLVSVAILGVLSVSPALAVPPGDIVLGDITVMRIRTDSGGVSAEQRASKVQERINKILAIPNLTAKDVTIVESKYGPTLYIHKVKIITVDPDTAKDQGTTPELLAKNVGASLDGCHRAGRYPPSRRSRTCDGRARCYTCQPRGRRVTRRSRHASGECSAARD